MSLHCHRKRDEFSILLRCKKPRISNAFSLFIKYISTYVYIYISISILNDDEGVFFSLDQTVKRLKARSISIF